MKHASGIFITSDRLWAAVHRAPLFGASSCFTLALGLLVLSLPPVAHAADETTSAAATSTAATSSDFTTKSVDGVIVTTDVVIDEATLAERKTATLVLLHTNDIHEIIAAPADKLGGMAYLSGYIHDFKARRPDVVAINGGDMLEKGDRMGLASKGEVSYRAFGATGHDVTVPGNHDFVYGLDELLKNAKLSGVPMICAGIYDDKTGEPLFPETYEKKFGNVRVGLIGATIDNVVRRNNRSSTTRAFRQLASAGASTALGEHIDRLAKEMEPRVDLTVLIVHNGLWMGKKLANAAPLVDVVITGHTNEETPEPVKSNTGAIILAVGRAGKWVGTMDMIVDLEANRIGKYTYEMTPMDHTRIKPDEKLAAQIREWEKQWADVPLPTRARRGDTGTSAATAAPQR